MQAVTSRVERWIFEEYRASSPSLGLLRIFFCVYLLLKVVPAATWTAGLPAVFYAPPLGTPSLLGGFPTHGVAAAANALFALSALLLLLGWRTRWTSLATSGTLLLLRSMEYSTGKINHDILLVLIPAIFAFSPWGEAFSLDSRRRSAGDDRAARGSWSVALLAFCLSLAMFSAGGLKLVSGWLDPATQSAYGHFIVNRSIGRETLLGDLMLSVPWTPLWESIDWGTTLLEIGFPIAMLRARWMTLQLGLASVFHLLVWLCLDIRFDSNLVAYLCIVAASMELPGGRMREPSLASESAPR